MEPQNKKLNIPLIIISALVLIGIVYVIARNPAPQDAYNTVLPGGEQTSEVSTDGGNSSSSVAGTPRSGPITVKGSLVCMPHANKKGPQTMECAYGIMDTNGRVYAIRDTDPLFANVSNIPLNVPVEIQGTFSTNRDAKYLSVGTIEIKSVLRTDTFKNMAVPGVFACLPYKNPAEQPAVPECSQGFQTNEKVYYALDFKGNTNLQSKFKSGQKAVISGMLMPIEDLAVNRWVSYPIKGVFSVVAVDLAI